MVDVLERSALDFQSAAAVKPPQRAITVNLDADVLKFLEAEGLKLDENINSLLRFYMDTILSKEREFAPESWEPGEMDSPPPPP